MKKNSTDFLPLTETTFLILSALWQPLHGYGIMQKVDHITNSRIVLAPGTLYGALSKLTKDKLIEICEVTEDKKKIYILTEMGREVVMLEVKRLENLLKESKNILGGEFFEG